MGFFGGVGGVCSQRKHRVSDLMRRNIVCAVLVNKIQRWITLQIRITAAVCSVIILTFHPVAGVRFVWWSFKRRLINYLRLTTSSGNTQPPRPHCHIYHNFLMFRVMIQCLLCDEALFIFSWHLLYFSLSQRPVQQPVISYISQSDLQHLSASIQYNTNTSVYGLSFLMSVLKVQVAGRFSDIKLHCCWTKHMLDL